MQSIRGLKGADFRFDSFISQEYHLCEYRCFEKHLLIVFCLVLDIISLEVKGGLLCLMKL